MDYKKLKELFDAGTDDDIIGSGEFTKTWRETEVGLVLQVEKVDTGEIQYLQVVGGGNAIYYPDA